MNVIFAWNRLYLYCKYSLNKPQSANLMITHDMLLWENIQISHHLANCKTIIVHLFITYLHSQNSDKKYQFLNIKIIV